MSLKAGDKFSLGESSKVFRLVRGMAAASEKKSFAASVQRTEDVLDIPSISPVPQHFSTDGMDMSTASSGHEDLFYNGQSNLAPSTFGNNEGGSQDAYMHTESSREGEQQKYIPDEFHGNKIIDYDMNHCSSDSRSEGNAYSSSISMSMSDAQRGGVGNCNGESYNGKGKYVTANSNANSNADSSGHAHAVTQQNSSSSGNYFLPSSNTSKSRTSSNSNSSNNNNSHGVGPYGPGSSAVTTNGSYLKNDKSVEISGAKEIILKENTYIDKYGNVKFICRDAIEENDRHGSARLRDKDKDRDKDRDRNSVRDQGTPSKSIEKKSDGKGGENGRKGYRDGERRNRSRSRSRSAGRPDSRERDSGKKDNRYRRKRGQGSVSRSMDRSRDRNTIKLGKITSNANRQGSSVSGGGGGSRGRSSSRSRNKRNTGSRNSISNGNRNNNNSRKRSFSSSRSRSYSRSRSPGGRKGWTNGGSGRRGNRDSRSHSRSRTYSRSPHKDRDRDRRRRTPSRSRSRSLSKSRGRSGDRDRDWKDKGRSKGGGGGSKNNARRSRSRSRTSSRRRDRDRISRSREGDKDKDKDKGNASKYQRKNNNDRMAVYGSADSFDVSKYQAQPAPEVRVNKYQAPAQESEVDALKRIENRKNLLESEWQRELVRREREAVVELQRKEREKERDKSSAAFQRYSSSAMVVQSEEEEAGQDVDADAGEESAVGDTYEKYESYGGEAQALSSSGTDCDREGEGEGEEFIQEQGDKLSGELDDMGLTNKAGMVMGANGSSDRDVGWMKVGSVNSKSAASEGEEEAEDGQCEGDVSALELDRHDDAGSLSIDIAAADDSEHHIMRGASMTESSSSRPTEGVVSCSRDEGVGARDARTGMRPEQAGGNDENMAVSSAADFDYNDINRLLSSGGECSRLGSLTDLDLDHFQSADAENGDFLFELDSDINSGNVMRDVES